VAKRNKYTTWLRDLKHEYPLYTRMNQTCMSICTPFDYRVYRTHSVTTSVLNDKSEGLVTTELTDVTDNFDSSVLYFLLIFTVRAFISERFHCCEYETKLGGQSVVFVWTVSYASENKLGSLFLKHKVASSRILL
jgi:hypothetical protein